MIALRPSAFDQTLSTSLEASRGSQAFSLPDVKEWIRSSYESKRRFPGAALYITTTRAQHGEHARRSTSRWAAFVSRGSERPSAMRAKAAVRGSAHDMPVIPADQRKRWAGAFFGRWHQVLG